MGGAMRSGYVCLRGHVTVDLYVPYHSFFSLDYLSLLKTHGLMHCFQPYRS